jgi:hypothetical protein
LEKIIWENTATIHNVLNKKTLKSYILNKLNIKKIKSTDIILEKKNKKKTGKKNHVGNIVAIHNVL